MPKSHNCTKCGKFLGDDPAWDGAKLKSRCKTCLNNYSLEYAKAPDAKLRKKELELIRRYGMSKERYDRLLEFQQGGCAICRQPCAADRDLAVDHNHNTGEVRGLLCLKCNSALGALNEDEDLIWNMLEYLKRTTWDKKDVA